MGKKRITQLLEQLKHNQQQDIQNAAAIYTVAQVAVNELQAQVEQMEPPPPAALSAASTLTKADLERRYGSYNGCRKAAKQLGIRFQGTPRWPQLVRGFEYYETIQQLVSLHMAAHPAPDLVGVRIEVEL